MGHGNFCPSFHLTSLTLKTNIHEIQLFFATRGIHILGMAETWLKPSISDGELLIPHYKLFRKDRAGRGGGVGFYCHESLAIRRGSDLESTDLELIWIDVGSGEHTCRVGCGYRPPNMSRAY